MLAKKKCDYCDNLELVGTESVFIKKTLCCECYIEYICVLGGDSPKKWRVFGVYELPEYEKLVEKNERRD